MNSQCSSPSFSARRFASGPVALLRIVISHRHDGRKGRRLRNLVQHRKWPIVSGSQGHDSEVRVSEFFFFFLQLFAPRQGMMIAPNASFDPEQEGKKPGGRTNGGMVFLEFVEQTSIRSRNVQTTGQVNSFSYPAKHR